MPNARFTGPSARDPAGDGVGDDLGDGVDVGEVAALLPVAVHDERLAGERGVDERGHHRGVRVPGRPATARTR